MRILYCASEANPFCGSGTFPIQEVFRTHFAEKVRIAELLFRFTAQFRRNLKTP
jgi:23S rRNA G2445 N2-methylase RlmL